MAGASGGRSLEETPTWAVAVVCFVLVLISVIIEQVIHMIGKWLRKNHKRALYEALEKIKSASSETKCAPQGKVPFVSSDGIHHLHIFIFVLALFHVLYCVLTLALGRAKMRSWKRWEKETRTIEYQFSHDPERFRFTRETSFGRRHLSFWTKNPVLMWIVCFFRQFVRSVPKVDYLTLRHGFIMAHLAPNSETKFDFQKYINRSLEEDFNVVVGISPPIWFLAVLFLLFNTHGWYSYLWMPFIPLIVILLVGTKLQVIITKMGLRIHERGEVVKGVPVVQPGDDLFWFNRPRLILYLINFVLFQNAFQLAFFAWTWVRFFTNFIRCFGLDFVMKFICLFYEMQYEFGLKSCFHEHVEDVVIRISMGVLIQILCSYVTLPLYALVTQMGSNIDGSSTSHCHIDVVEQDQVEYVDKDVNESSLSEQLTVRTIIALAAMFDCPIFQMVMYNSLLQGDQHLEGFGTCS
ncbi:MLO-like protein 6 [Hibiscus syriacus]|uniref:MLO-like protein 6 n=1 Tax=Hibiscus syriacus TaxID=106335 RepID=UPI0019218CE3|nr:MLO-like protein 6 [Hibiscus syriacus]